MMCGSLTTIVVCCEDTELDTSNGRRQIAAAACSDAGRYSGDAREVFRLVEVANRK